MKERVNKLKYPTFQHSLRMLYTTNGNSTSISDGQSDRKPVLPELHKIVQAKVQKGYKLLIKKIKSAFPVKCTSTHYVLFNYKFSRNSVEQFQWSPRTVLRSIFNFGQISKFKMGHYYSKKNIWNQYFLWICTSTHYVLHNYKVSGHSVERLQRSCAYKLFYQYPSFWSNF